MHLYTVQYVMNYMMVVIGLGLGQVRVRLGLDGDFFKFNFKKFPYIAEGMSVRPSVRNAFYSKTVSATGLILGRQTQHGVKPPRTKFQVRSMQIAIVVAITYFYGFVVHTKHFGMLQQANKRQKIYSRIYWNLQF